ncbi:MAG: Do family serine endopeptidase [Bacteroidota bacterium]
MNTKKLSILLGLGFLLVLLGSGIGAGIYANFFEKDYVYLPQPALPTTFSSYTEVEVPPQPKRSESLTDATMDFVVASEIARPAVVHIKSRYEVRRNNRETDFFSNPFKDYFEDDLDNNPQGMASGSGVLISPDGYIATNNHVIDEADKVEVTLYDNRTFTARVIGTDVATDLALLKLDAADLPHLSFGNSDEVKVGQWVLAVGNPMDLTSTVTAGIVSAKGRNINLLRADSEFAIESFIQTDAAVNKGNSGGALVNIHGDLIGINTAIASRTGYYAGYSFAIPATIARKVMEDLLAFGEVRRGFLGVSIQPVDATLAERFNLSVLKGAYVSQVNEDLGAAEAGIIKGDVIVSVNGKEVNSSSELQEQVSRYRPGDRIRVKAFRGETEKEFVVVLKQITRNSFLASDESPRELDYKGSVFRPLSEEEYLRLDIEKGVMVNVAGDKMAKGGIQDGFVITEVDGKEIKDLDELEEALKASGEYITIKGLYSKGMIASYSFGW